jgi:hypothetical protein
LTALPDSYAFLRVVLAEQIKPSNPGGHVFVETVLSASSSVKSVSPQYRSVRLGVRRGGEG